MYSFLVEVIGIAILVAALIKLFLNFYEVLSLIEVMQRRISCLAAYRDEDMNQIEELKKKIRALQVGKKKRPKNKDGKL